jgi:hypothetical protein
MAEFRTGARNIQERELRIEHLVVPESKNKTKPQAGHQAHAYNPNNSRGRDQEDYSLKPAWENSS